METNSNQKVSCIVNYAYKASEEDELTLRVGDVVRDVDRLGGGWWRGELRGQRGMFPDNFVSVLNENTNNARSTVQGRCRAVFSYQPANPDELPLCVGDVLDVLGEVEEGWWQGRRQGRVGVFPSNFVVMLDPPQPAAAPAPFEPAPALPPKPVKEQCRVLFPYTAVNEDELTLAEGDIVTIVSKDAPDRGWWRGELHGRVGLFPDNFVQMLPSVPATAIPQETDEKKPERPPSKTSGAIYPILNKYSEKTASVKELTTSRISLHKENSVTKESNTQSTVTHTTKNETDKQIHNETVTDGTPDGQPKKPPVPVKKSPTPATGVGGLFSGLKSKMLPSIDKDKEKDKEKEKEKPAAPSHSNSLEWDRADGALASKPHATTFDHVERNSILNDPRAGRVKAPRRRPPSQALRDDTPLQIGLSNGHEVPTEKPADKAEEIKPRPREWEKHRAPWMDELKLNQAKKTSVGPDKPRNSSGSTDRILECGLEEKRATHSMEMSRSTSSITNRISLLDSFDDTKVRHSLDSRKDSTPPPVEPPKTTAQSPTAAGRTFSTMLEDLKKQPPPSASARASDPERSPVKAERTLATTTTTTSSSSEKHTEVTKVADFIEKASSGERSERSSESVSERVSSLERRRRASERDDDTMLTHLNHRISNLEKLLEVQNAKFTAAIEELSAKLSVEAERRAALQAELDKLAHCVTSV